MTLMQNGTNHPEPYPVSRKLMEKNPMWKQLIETGKFEQRKALSTCHNLPKIYSKLRIRSTKEALTSELPSLVTVHKYKGGLSLFALLSSMLIELTEFFNVGKNMNEQQLKITCRMVYKEFYYLKVSDFRLCFDNAMCGKYGKVYDRIDGNIILEWLSKYNEERLVAAQDQSYRQHDGQKKEKIGFDKAVLNLIKEKVAYTPSQQKSKKTNSLEFKSLYNFCEYKGWSHQTIKSKIEAIWRASWRQSFTKVMAFKAYRTWSYNKLFYWINNDHHDTSIELLLEKVKSLHTQTTDYK